jgi:integrase/recombinase XerD
MGSRKGSRKREPDRLYQRSGIWYARVTVAGVEQRQSLKTGDREEATRRLEAWLAARSPYKGTIRHTWDEAAALWVEAGEWKDKTLRGYLKLLAILNQHFGSSFWDQVNKASLQGFIAARREAGSGTATINRYLSVVSGIADHVRELPGWPDHNPVKDLPRKARKERRQAYVRPPPEDVEAFFARMHGTFGDLCRFALLTGARKDEIASLKRADARNGRAQLWDTKSGFRVISLSPEAQTIVDRQPRSDSPYLFVSSRGDAYQRVTEMWREVVARAQIMAQREGRQLTRMRFHDLRHEYAIRYLEKGGSIYALQQLLGHSTIGQTEHYLRYLTPEQAAAAKA